MVTFYYEIAATLFIITSYMYFEKQSAMDDDGVKLFFYNDIFLCFILNINISRRYNVVKGSLVVIIFTVCAGLWF